MTTAVVGAGPVGMVCALALATSGEQVLLLDRDAGPAPDGTWRRTGVMQFMHPHFFRPQVRSVLEQHAPAMWEAVVAAGSVVNDPPPGLPPSITTVAARRSTFEGALRRALRDDRITFVPEHADALLVEGDRVVGLVAGGATYDVDRVLVATGRSGRIGEDLRPPGESGTCGQSYVSRMYRARPGVEPLVAWKPLEAQYDGYLTIVFPQDAGTLSALVVRRSHDPGWAPLWRNDAFDRVVAQIPNLAPWTDPDRFEPITDVLRGGTLVNAYRGQGTPPAGVFFVGDAVCTTNPSAGRGVSLGLLQAAALLDALAEHVDPKDASAAFDRWCDEQLRPWYDDHVAVDASTVRSYDGEPFDVEGPVASDVVVAACDVAPDLLPLVMPFLGMARLPSSLAEAEPRVRALLREGWRPAPQPGPTRDDLVEQLAALGAQPTQGGAGPVPSR